MERSLKVFSFSSFHVLILFVISLELLFGRALIAQWSGDASVNNPISTATGNQTSPQIIGDGAGGAIVAWADSRNGGLDIYAQKINANGTVQWTHNGVVICAATNDQAAPHLIADGSGGAIITWQDRRAGYSNPDIYAQRIGSSGSVQWTTNGVPICTATGYQEIPRVASDGAGGAIITWTDSRGTTSKDVYAQRINANGVTQWITNGFAIAVFPYVQDRPQIVSDGTGGAIIAWEDNRSGGFSDIYIQRVNGNGVEQWTTGGIALCTGTDSQAYPQIVGDGAGGAVVTWQDARNGLSADDIYSQKINQSGIVQWQPDGVPIALASSVTNGKLSPQLTSDGLAGAIISWEDLRNGIDQDIYIQRVNANGVVQWSTNGLDICTATNAQTSARLAPDGSNGAIITWMDARYNNNDIYAQKVSANGTRLWQTNGVIISSATNDQTVPHLVSDGSSGAIIAWQDRRNGNHDVFASRLFSNGTLPVELTMFSATRIRDNIELRWSTIHETNNYGFYIERRSAYDSSFTTLANGFIPAYKSTVLQPSYTFTDTNLPADCDIFYRLKQVDYDGKYDYSHILLVSMSNSDEDPDVALHCYPNPFGVSDRSSTMISYRLSEALEVSLNIYDESLRKVATLRNGYHQAGIYTVSLSSDEIRSGLYYCLLNAGRTAKMIRLVVMK